MKQQGSLTTGPGEQRQTGTPASFDRWCRIVVCRRQDIQINDTHETGTQSKRLHPICIGGVITGDIQINDIHETGTKSKRLHPICIGGVITGDIQINDTHETGTQRARGYIPICIGGVITGDIQINDTHETGTQSKRLYPHLYRWCDHRGHTDK